ncbi:MAG TPA: glycosyltransferase family 39 protein, partial [Blastocatellia bacterium]|nr:glycosyltransferase family 39 protein [Blastocatellia bacterium]
MRNHPRRHALTDRLPLVVTIVAGLVCYGLFYRRGIWLSVVAYSVAPAERVMQGEIPYRDFLFNYTPGILWLNASLMKLFGVSLITVNWGLYLFKLAALIALYLVGKRVVGAWPALIPVALALCWLGHRYVFNVHPTQYYMVFALAALACMVGYTSRPEKFHLLFCGVLIAAVLLFKYNVGLLLIAAATGNVLLASLALTGSFRSSVFTALRGIGMLWTGFGIVVAAFVIWLRDKHALGPMVDHFAHHAAEYSEERAIGLPPLRWLLPVSAAAIGAAAGAIVVARRKPKLLEPYLWLVLVTGSVLLLVPVRAGTFKQSATTAVAYLPPLVFAATLGLLLQDLRKSDGSASEPSWWKRNRALVTVSLFALSVYLEVYPRADYYHLVRVLPPVFLVLSMILLRVVPAYARLLGIVSGRSRSLLVVLPLVLLALVGLKDTWRPQFDEHFRFVDRVPVNVTRAQGVLVSERDAVVIDEVSRIIASNSTG